jgi:hypothetical protein
LLGFLATATKTPCFITGSAPIGSNRCRLQALFKHHCRNRNFRFIMRKHIQSAGFMPPARRVLGSERRTVAIAELVASIALALSTLVAATVVSVGIARADVVGNVIDNESGLFAIALLLGLLFIGMGGLTILSLPHLHRHKKTHS